MLNLLIKEYLAVCEYLLEVVTRNRESKDTLPMVSRKRGTDRSAEQK